MPGGKRGTKPRIRLICWDAELAREHAAALDKAGFATDASPFRHERIVGRIRESNPAAVVFDLDRRFSHGHAVAVFLRSAKSTCQIPLVFAGGAPEKVEQLRRKLQHVYFADWTNAASVIRQALSASPLGLKPQPFMAQYSGSSLVKKLGIKAGHSVVMLGAPDGFEEQLTDLPDGVTFQTAITRRTGLALWFVRSRDELEREIGFVAARLPAGISVWIIYPKQTSKLRVDFNQYSLRETAAAVGLADYKICAVDSDWTGMKFARKRAPRGRATRD